MDAGRRRGGGASAAENFFTISFWRQPGRRVRMRVKAWLPRLTLPGAPNVAENFTITRTLK